MPETDLRDVLAALEDVDFPAEEDEPVRAAEAGDEPEPVVAALRAFPPVEYANRDEVARSVPTRPASDREYTPAKRAEQARRRQLSQYQRDVPNPAVQDEPDR